MITNNEKQQVPDPKYPPSFKIDSAPENASKKARSHGTSRTRRASGGLVPTFDPLIHPDLTEDKDQITGGCCGTDLEHAKKPRPRSVSGQKEYAEQQDAKTPTTPTGAESLPSPTVPIQLPQPESVRTAGDQNAGAESVPSHGRTAIQFPPTAIVGSLGKAAQELTIGTEVPTESVYGALLTMLGLAVSGSLSLNIGMKHDTRLYTVLVGDSGDAKKSSALRIAREFFDSIGRPLELPFVLQGAGSAEGLAGALEESKTTLLMYDEVRSFLDKTRIQGSVLLPMVTQLYEHDQYENYTKERHVSVHGVKLGFIGCATTGTYENMWTPEAIAIGFPNRLFIVGASRRPKVLFPEERDEAALRKIRSKIREQVKRLPLTFEFTPEAQAELEDWYSQQPGEEHARRLDTIARSLLPLIALITDKDAIDLETAKIVRSIVEYELQIRRLLDPIDAEGTTAKLEEKIRRVLKTKGSVTLPELKRACNYTRHGLHRFGQAVSNLKSSGEIKDLGKKLTLVEQTPEETT